MVLHAGKTQKNGKLALAGGGRHQLPSWDLHNALGKNFVTRHTILKVPFPAPDSPDWYEAPLVEGMWQNDPVSYRQAAEVLTKQLDRLGIKIDKVMHAFRVFAAQALDEAGVDDAVSEQHDMGSWVGLASSSTHDEMLLSSSAT